MFVLRTRPRLSRGRVSGQAHITGGLGTRSENEYVPKRHVAARRNGKRKAPALKRRL